MHKILTSLLLGLLLSTSAQAQIIKSIQPSIDSLISPVEPFIKQYTIVPIYYPWMMQLAGCEKLRLPPLADFQAFKFYLVNTTAFQVNNDATLNYIAVTVSSEKIMYISIAHVYNRGTIFHELLHILLYYNFPDGRYTGTGSSKNESRNHPKKYFDRCGVNDKY